MRRIEAFNSVVDVMSRRCRGRVMSVRKNSTWILTSPCILFAGDPHLPIPPCRASKSRTAKSTSGVDGVKEPPPPQARPQIVRKIVRADTREGRIASQVTGG